ncbi:CgeB family protein [Paenibacillus piri]|uniref:Spore maturation protein cgeB n=1 Tax=Paenibacillus piri TaxID=2547395 RepID=A0A4R5KPF7_9BACL|nr:glycosyltransferase [Paenibacillus piri]TDF97561.1 spore maturation protein cgeB [Paenibacillus piri]
MARKTVRRRLQVRHMTAGWRKGRSKGLELGNEHGYHLGRCEAAIQKSKPSPPGWWNVRVLYITSGKGVPYSPLDQSIIEAFQLLVRELVIVTPTQDFVSAARQLRPDFVLVLDGMYIPAYQVDQIRAEGIRTAVWFTDDPYYTDATVQMAVHYDFVFTLELECVDFYRQNGCAQVHYLPFGSNVSVFRPKRIPLKYRKDISFIGSAYWNRVGVFDHLAGYFKNKDCYISGIWWDRLRHYSKLSSKIDLNKWMDAKETASYYNGTKIVINLHRASDDTTFNYTSRSIGAVSPNPRTFEIAGCGTLQLSDTRSDLPRFYTPGVEIVTYSSPDELKEKIDYYLNHEEERREIALNALRRTMQEHTYTHRIASMLRLIFG